MNFIPAAISQGVARQSLTVAKHSPAILFGVGVAGMIGSTVLACRATLKLDETVESTKKELERVKKANSKTNGGPYSEKERKHDTYVVYRQGIFKLVKLYGPSVLMGAAAVACLAKSHNILVQRNAALTAAYVAVDSAFKKYRSRVVDKYGVEEDLHFMHDSEPVDIINEKGNITHSTRVSSTEPSMYARFFDQLCTEWSRDPEYNLVYLKHQQSFANHNLRMRGHVFLNEVYDALGMERTKEGSVVGWILSDDGSTDNHIDFGLYEDNPRARDFINGREGSILLDFNVDGLIYDLVGNPERIKWQS